ncbi:MAG: hypothetical protein VB912_06725, partial [Pirellulaceae bacterium]
MGVLVLFFLLMKAIQDSNRGGSTATPTETAEESLIREQTNRDAEAERQRQELERRTAENRER